MLNPLRHAVRALALVLLLLGIAVWLGHPVPWRGIHMGVGVVLALALLALGAVAARATGRAGPFVALLAWAVVLVGYGVAHPRLLPGDAHWVAQLVHVLVGLASIGVAEGVAGRAGRARPTGA